MVASRHHVERRPGGTLDVHSKTPTKGDRMSDTTRGAVTAGLGQALGWGDDLDVSAAVQKLAEGPATFEVAMVARSRFEGSEKICPCPMAVLTLRVRDKEGQVADIERNVILNSKMAWLIGDLMRSVGLLGEGSGTIKSSMWDQLEGRKGVCEVVTVTSGRGTTYSSVERFVHGDEAKTALSELGRELD